MEIHYGSNKLKKQMSNATELKKAFGEMAMKVSFRLDDIRSSPNLYILMQLPAAKCHPLTGNRKGEWSVAISGNFRMIFIIANEPIPQKKDNSIDTMRVTEIKIIGTEDYH